MIITLMITTPASLTVSFASRLVMAGVDLRTVQDLMGHKMIAMTLRYSHLSPAHKLDAVERLVPVEIEQASDTTTDTAEAAVGGDAESVSEVTESKDEKWWRWVDLNYRPRDYESHRRRWRRVRVIGVLRCAA